MRPLVVVAVQPSVEFGLKRVDALEQGGVHHRQEELLENRAVEALDEAAGAPAADLGLAVLDVVEGQVELIGMALGAAWAQGRLTALPLKEILGPMGSTANEAAAVGIWLRLQERPRQALSSSSFYFRV